MFDWFFLVLNRYVTSNSRRLARAAGYAPYWLVRRTASAKLVAMLRHVWRHNPYQRERWKSAGVTRRDLRSPGVLRHIPFCDSGKLAENPEAFFCAPPQELTNVIVTSGTTGEAKKVYLTRDDLHHQARMMGAHLRRLPGASRAMILFSLTSAPGLSPAPLARRGLEMAGMFGLTCASKWSPQTHIGLIREYRIDTVIATPTRLHKITLEAKTDLKTLGVKYLLLSTEPWTEKLRTEFETAWGARAIDVYGSNEFASAIASECIYQDGLHLAEVNFWIEIIDPETGQVVDDGTDGEVVVTTLSRRGMPLVRYRIGDIAHLLPMSGRCACGMSVRKLSRIRGRADNMVTLGGGYNVYPDEFDRAILGVPGVVDYQLVIEKDGYKDVLKLDVETTLRDEELKETMTRALRKINNILKGRDLLSFGRFRSVPFGSLSEGRTKTVRIVDKRN